MAAGLTASSLCPGHDLPDVLLYSGLLGTPHLFHLLRPCPGHPHGKEGQAIQLRLFYLLLAVALVLVVNRFLVPTRKATQFRHNLRTLCRLQASYWELVQRSLHAPGRPERSGEILACFHLVYHEAARYAAALPAGEAERYRTVLLTLWNLFAHVEQVECLVLTGELGEEEYPVLSRLAGEIQELLDPPGPHWRSWGWKVCRPPGRSAGPWSATGITPGCCWRHGRNSRFRAESCGNR